MKRALTLSGVLMILMFVGSFTGNAVAVAQTASRIDAIRKLCREIDDRVALSEQTPEASTTFLTELKVNKNLSPYPAVGIYQTVVKFYYTFGDREKEPYPNRLLKIIVTTDRSDRKEYSEFVFDEAERLAFYFEKKDDIERRLYLAAERPIRLQQGEQLVNLPDKSQGAIVATVLKDRANLVAMFRRSLAF